MNFLWGYMFKSCFTLSKKLTPSITYPLECIGKMPGIRLAIYINENNKKEDNMIVYSEMISNNYSGYDYQKNKSKRALAAEEEGMVQYSKISKILKKLYNPQNSKYFQKVMSRLGDEWHHCGVNYRKVYYFSQNTVELLKNPIIIEAYKTLESLALLHDFIKYDTESVNFLNTLKEIPIEIKHIINKMRTIFYDLI